MMTKNLNAMIRAAALALAVLGLCMLGSCKKATEEPAPPAPQDVNEAPQTPDIPDAPDTPGTPDAPDTPDAPAPAVGDAAPTGWVPLEIELPKPMFVGTPQDMRVPNLRKPLGKARPPILVPAGVKNVALNKPVSASDEEPIIGEISMITDGDKEGADGSYVELAPFVQNVTIDLEAKYKIYAIVVWHYHMQPRVYYDVVVQMANDADFISDVQTVFNNDMDNSAGHGIGKDMHYSETSEGELIECKGIEARYVRLYSNGSTSNDLNHYIEVDVYGLPAE